MLVASRAPDATYGRVALAPGDVITAMNGEPVTSLAQLRAAIGSVGVGQSVVLHVERRGRLEFMAFEME